MIMMYGLPLLCQLYIHPVSQTVSAFALSMMVVSLFSPPPAHQLTPAVLCYVDYIITYLNIKFLIFYLYAVFYITKNRRIILKKKVNKSLIEIHVLVCIMCDLTHLNYRDYFCTEWNNGFEFFLQVISYEPDVSLNTALKGIDVHIADIFWSDHFCQVCPLSRVHELKHFIIYTHVYHIYLPVIVLQGYNLVKPWTVYLFDPHS